MDFTFLLLSWYKDNKRDLPWRHTTNPYYIWLSEIILQQTRVDQGLPYYHSFINNFPTIKDLAIASEDQVLKLWQGLGYYSRARNLHKTARTIYYEKANKFPQSYKEIIKLHGIGPYTAAAISSFAFKEPIAVVDGNVFRVLSRIFGIYEDISKVKNRHVFQNLANELISIEQPDLFNHALMDFGSLICTPTNPKCASCNFQNHCYAFLKKQTTTLPVKNSKTKVKNRYLNYIILKTGDKVAIQQRIKKDIWQQLYQFPLIETPTPNDKNVLKILSQQYRNQTIIKLTQQPIKHKLSHQQLYINIYMIENMVHDQHYKTAAIQELANFAFPIVLWNFIKDFFKLEKK